MDSQKGQDHFLVSEYEALPHPQVFHLPLQMLQAPLNNEDIHPTSYRYPRLPQWQALLLLSYPLRYHVESVLLLLNNQRSKHRQSLNLLLIPFASATYLQLMAHDSTC